MYPSSHLLLYFHPSCFPCDYIGLIQVIQSYLPTSRSYVSRSAKSVLPCQMILTGSQGLGRGYFRGSFVLSIANTTASGVEKKDLFESIRSMTLCITKDRLEVINKPLSHFHLFLSLLLFTSCPSTSATDHALTLHSYNCLHIFPSFLTCGRYLSIYTYTMHVSTHEHTNPTETSLQGQKETPFRSTF